MTDQTPIRSLQIDRQLEEVSNDADETGLALVREILEETSDRWYGRLVASVYDSLSNRRNPEPVVQAATAIELLWGYVRLRSRLLVTLTDKHAHSITMDPTSTLLAGDYLYASAFSALSSVHETRSSGCFETLTVALETITEAFWRTYTPTSSTNDNSTVFFEETAGNLGEAAAVLGAKLAGFDESHREYFEQFGRGLSTARQIEVVLNVPPSEATVVPPSLDETSLRTHAEQRRDDVAQALEALSEVIDAKRLRTFAETTASGRDHECWD